MISTYWTCVVFSLIAFLLWNFSFLLFWNFIFIFILPFIFYNFLFFKIYIIYLWWCRWNYMAENIVRYSKEDQEKKEELESRWSHLPTELLCLVSSHLLLWDFTILRAVCKSWRSSTSLIRPFPSLIDSPHLLSPCLMSIDYHKCRFFHPT